MSTISPLVRSLVRPLVTPLTGRVFETLDADAAAYIAAVVDAGGVVSGGQKSAINTFYKTGKSDGWYSSLKRVYLPIWEVAAPNAIDMIARGSGTFVGGVTHGAGFIQGNGSTGYFNTNSIPSVIGMTTTSASFGILTIGGGVAANQIMIGARSASNNRHYIQWNGASLVNAIYKAPGTAPISASMTLSQSYGIISFQYTTPNRSLNIRRASGRSILGTAGDGSGGVPSVATYLGANNNADVADLFSAYQIGAAFLGVGMSDTQDAAFTLALKTLWEGLTGLSLP
jgi:hypothetical protein